MEGQQGRRVGEYVLGKQIGSGAFSVVWQDRRKGSSDFDQKEEEIDVVAVKEISVERLNKKLRDSLLSEVPILRHVHHPNIIALFDSIHDHDHHTIFPILEFCPGNDLSSYILRRPRLPESTAKHFMRQLASGLQVLRITTSSIGTSSPRISCSPPMTRLQL